MKKGNEVYALKIYHNESQIKQGFTKEELHGGGLERLKKDFDFGYNNEAMILEKVEKLKSPHIVRLCLSILIGCVDLPMFIFVVPLPRQVRE